MGCFVCFCECIHANKRRLPNVGLVLGHRRRRWTNTNPTLGKRLMFECIYIYRALTVTLFRISIFPARVGFTHVKNIDIEQTHIVTLVLKGRFYHFVKWYIRPFDTKFVVFLVSATSPRYLYYQEIHIVSTPSRKLYSFLRDIFNYVYFK